MPSSRSVSYGKALAEIYSLDRFGSRLGLERITRMLELLGNPQAIFRCVLVGGSNGKGSTVEMIGSVLGEQGWRVGTYFSPQVEEFPERIRINGKNAGKKEIAEAYAKVSAVCSENRIPATFFEVVTAMALLIFRQRKVEFAVLEVGLGGRLDATNAVEPSVSAITSVSLEHTSVLGRTIADIAREKCGIARKGKPLVCGLLSWKAETAVGKECGKTGAKPIFARKEVHISNMRKKNGAYSFKAAFRGIPYSISLSAPGKFQAGNASVALAVCSLLGASREAIARGLAKAVIKYRLQDVSSSPRVVADCAHNPEAAAALAKEVRGMRAERHVLLFSAMKDKDYQTVLRNLGREFEDIVITEVSLGRAANVRELERAAQETRVPFTIVKNPKKALAAAKGLAGKKGLVVVAGSIYLLAELFGRDKIRAAQ